MKFNRNNQIMLILYFIVVIFLLIQLYELYSLKNEHFYNNDSKKVQNVNIQSIMLSPYDNDEHLKYFGTFIKNSDKDDINNSLYLYETYDLKSPTWNRVKYDNMLLEKNKKVIITDISFDKSKRMIVIGLYYKNKKPIYNIYRRNADNLIDFEKGKWDRISNDVNIRSICHDITNDNKIIGISSYDGQIYYNNGDYMNWIGPIKYNGDVPLRKVMYTLDTANADDTIMIGIGLFDNYIYKKEGADWKNTDWEKTPINTTKVRDLIYSNYGELIATTSNGIMIQKQVGISFEFISIDNKIFESNNDHSNSKIFKSKLGFDIDNKNLFDTNNMARATEEDKAQISMRDEAKDTYDFKKNLLDYCTKRKFLKNKNNVSNDFKDVSNELDEINLKHQKINELYTKIEDINQYMSK
jgi:hypothetical protein